MGINYYEKGNAAVIVLNRPNYLNTLTFDMVEEIDKILDAISINDKINLVIFTGEGDKAFCAGGDVKSFYEEKFSESNELRKKFFYFEYKLNYKINTFNKPIISLIHGICMGGGVGLAMHKNIVVVSENVTFAMPETAIGLFPDVGAGKILTELEGNIGAYLALTGKRVKTPDLLTLGLATKCVKREMFADLEKELSLTRDKKDILKVIDSCSMNLEPTNFANLITEISECFKFDSIEEIIDVLKNNNSDWAKEAIDSINKMSPTSLKITLRQLRLAENMSLAEDLIMEYRLSQGCMRGHDFYEGVRAVLVDKDHNPKWNPDSLEKVNNEIVLDHFKPLGEDDLNLN